MSSKIKVRVRLVIIKKQKILVYYDSIDDYYFYPGGKVEFGETIMQGLKREVSEELGEDVSFTYKKILYIRDFIMEERNEHSIEFYILGDIDKFEEVEKRPDPEHDGKKWPTWLDINDLPENLYPKKLTQRILSDRKKGFPGSGEYLERMQ